MGFSLKNIIGNTSAKGQVTDGHLLLSFPDAMEPVVWRMELDKIGTASFEVKQDDEAGTAKLVLKPKKGTAEVIAPFSSKEEAVEALLIASNALQNAKPQATIISDTTKQPAKKVDEQYVRQYEDVSHRPAENQNQEATKWLLAVFGAIFVIGLYYYLTTLIPERIPNINNQTATSINSSDPTNATGVPVSADDFLGGL